MLMALATTRLMMPIIAGTRMNFMPQKMSLNEAIQVPMPLDAVSSLIGGLPKRAFGSVGSTSALRRSNASLVGSLTQMRLMHLSAMGCCLAHCARCVGIEPLEEVLHVHEGDALVLPVGQLADDVELDDEVLVVHPVQP